MTDETLSQANDIQRQIRDAQYRAYYLDKATVGINNLSAYDLKEEAIELIPEEQEALKSLREAYLTILRTANDRHLSELQTLFQSL